MTRRVVLALFVVCGVVVGLGAQAKPSSTPLRAGDREAIEKAGPALIAAINTGRSADGLALYSAATRSAVGDDRIAAQFTRLRETLGALEYHSAHLSEFPRGAQWSRILHVFAKAAVDGRWRNFQITIEPSRPFRLDQIVFIAEVAEPVYLPNADLPDPNTRRWLNDYIDALVAKEGLAGSVLVTRGAETIFARTFGHADAAGTRRIDADTRFSMASASKMFTAVLVAKLAEAGRLAYGDPISRHLPPEVMTDEWKAVTVDHLLSHRSGIGEYWTREFSEARPDLRTARDFVPWIHKVPASFPPGTGYRYSNSNFILLGLIIEHVTGRPYADELQRVILTPLRMTSTSLVTDPLPASRDAQPLARDGQGWVHSGLRGRGSPAGGAFTTVGDATRFLRALATGRLVSADTLTIMTTPRNEGADGYPYGYALEMRRDGGALSWGHGGIASGVNAELRYFPTLDTTLVAFSNQNNGAYDDLKKNLIKLISGDR